MLPVLGISILPQGGYVATNAAWINDEISVTYPIAFPLYSKGAVICSSSYTTGYVFMSADVPGISFSIKRTNYNAGWAPGVFWLVCGW